MTLAPRDRKASGRFGVWTWRRVNQNRHLTFPSRHGDKVGSTRRVAPRASHCTGDSKFRFKRSRPTRSSVLRVRTGTRLASHRDTEARRQTANHPSRISKSTRPCHGSNIQSMPRAGRSPWFQRLPPADFAFLNWLKEKRRAESSFTDCDRNEQDWGPG